MALDLPKISFLQIFCPFALVTFAHAEYRWTREIAVVNTKMGYVGPGVDFKIDATGTVHACYSSTETTGDATAYVRWTPGGQQELVKLSDKARRTYFAKIALKSNGDPVIAFVDEQGVKIAKRSDGAWSVQTISSSDHYEFADLSLAVDPSNQAHVLYNGYDFFMNRAFLKYMHEGQDGWISEYFHSSGSGSGNHGQFHDIALSEAGEPHIVFQSNDSLSSPVNVKYAHENSEGDFVVENVSDWNNTGDIEMCLESGGVIHVVHPGFNSNLSYSRRSVDGVWSDQVIVNPNDSSSIQSDYPDVSVERGIPTIGYKNLYSRISVATLKAGVWTFSESPDITGDFGPVLSRDHQGRICCLYSDNSKLWLKFAPHSFLPKMQIRSADSGSVMIDLDGLTPHTNYVLKRSPDLVRWTRVQDISSEVGFYSFEEIKSDSSGFYRIELQN